MGEDLEEDKVQWVRTHQRRPKGR